MAQLILAVTLTVAVVVFGMVNTHHVALSYVFGDPVQIRMVFALSMAFLAGSLSTVFYQLITRLGRRADRRRRRAIAD